MIKVSIKDLIGSTEALQKLASMELKAKTSWQIGRILKSADTEIQSFNETRMNLIKKYGEKDENGELMTDDKGNCRILEEGVKEFTSELNDLITQEVELNANKVAVEDLDGKEFTPAEMAQLEMFIDFGEEE